MTQDAPPPGSIMIPAVFWRDHVTAAEMTEIMQRGGLDRGQCIKLWEMLGRADPPPASLELMIRRADVERIWPSTKGTAP